ncbi:MAG TPA: hypothetical protein VEL31_26070 [Ktedonobacteraceae bacterium]|nr:hypothetical protein [Ktedonobacteraceae bacterium]
MKQPAKTTIRVNTIIESTLKNLEGAKEDVHSTPAVNGLMTYFIDALAQALLTEEQHEQVKAILSLWKESRYGDRSSEDLVESGRPSVSSPRRVS